jgi:hypothetical protein
MFRSAAQKLSLQTATQTRTLLTHNGIRSLSTEAPSSGGILNRIKNTFGSSNSDSIPGSGSKSKPSAQDEAYAKQISQMAHSEKWSLANFHQQVVDSSGGWKAKLPGMGNTDAVKQMKAMQQLLEAAMEVAGRDAGANELNDLGKKGKLKISLKSGADVSEINALVQQFKSMDIMHRVLRYRVENGLEIPTDEEGARTIMQNDVKNVLSDREMKEIQKERMKRMRKR